MVARVKAAKEEATTQILLQEQNCATVRCYVIDAKDQDLRHKTRLVFIHAFLLRLADLAGDLALVHSKTTSAVVAQVV
jgi:hypothetical protein